jgi:hypothetical protein
MAVKERKEKQKWKEEARKDGVTSTMTSRQYVSGRRPRAASDTKSKIPRSSPTDHHPHHHHHEHQFFSTMAMAIVVARGTKRRHHGGWRGAEHEPSR